MKRATSIEALLRKARADFVDLKVAYTASLEEKNVREDLKVAIKNILENLRSCLDYLAHDISGDFSFSIPCWAGFWVKRLIFLK